MLDMMLLDAGYDPEDREVFDVAKKGLDGLVKGLLGAQHDALDLATIDALIADMDERISEQVDAILHNPEFQELESTWRELHYLVQEVDHRANVRVDLLSVSKAELLRDLKNATEISRTGFYSKVYSRHIGTYGGKPYGCICANYEFDYSSRDITLLRRAAAVAAAAHAPLLANAGPSMFRAESFEQLVHEKDLKLVFEGPEYAKWRSFRETPEARYVALCMPRFVLRLPYGPGHEEVRSFNYTESVVHNHDNYLWGHASIAMATRVAESFARYGWCTNIIGPKAGGQVENLPLHNYQAMGSQQIKCPLEASFDDSRAVELEHEGFIPLEFEQDTDRACFFSAASVQKPKHFGIDEKGKRAEANFRLSTQLPYLFLACRFAQYLKVRQKLEVGTWTDRAKLERDLNIWLRQFVVDLDDPDPVTRSQKPLRKASVVVKEIAGQPGRYSSSIELQPHLKLAGMDITLSLVSKLDKE